MSFLVVALLSLLWLGFFLPSLLQARRTSSPYASATMFQDSLRRLGDTPYPSPAHARTAPRRRPPRPPAATARRRDTLAVLGASVVAGVAIAVSFGGWATWVAVPPVVALATYVVLLRRDVVRRAAQRTAPASAHDAASVTAVADTPHAPVRSGEAPDLEIVPSVARRGASPSPERMAG